MQTAEEQGTVVNYSEIFLYLQLHYTLSLKRYAKFGVLMPIAEIICVEGAVDGEHE